MNQIDRHGFTNFDVVLFDLDGVITKTAVLHAAAWKRLFDEYLKKLAAHTGSGYEPFDPARDYRLYVDGKSRYDGVKDFLKSRNLTLPLGSPNDGPDQETIYGLGNKKDEYFDGCLRETGVVVYPGTVRYLHAARGAGLKTAVVSSSHHCREIIQSAGLASLFETRIDGHEIDRLHLHGKPAPDTFLEAARRLGVSPAKAIVIEDALAGVRAGQAGGFGLVIGVNRENQAEALRQHGADIVVADLAEMLPSEPETEPSAVPPAKNRPALC
ncbi:MAG TPA: beta-phosphoglucomutase family hydrolase [Nitrospira sp.]|nr:beta-phosphoglucomutase family hydrolase [Nitrospira sp.]